MMDGEERAPAGPLTVQTEELVDGTRSGATAARPPRRPAPAPPLAGGPPEPAVDPAAVDRPTSRVRSRLPAAVLTLVVLATLGRGLVGLPTGTVAALLLVLVGLTLSGAGLWLLVVPGATRGQSAVFGCLLGLSLVGLGVVLSGATGWYGVRWLPPALALVAWWPVARRSRATRGDGSRARGMGPGLWGAVFATAAMYTSVHRHLATAPLGDGGWRSWYVDLPWHMAFTAETLERAPSVYPWVPDVSLGYTWLFSAALGGWGSPTAVSAADLVTRVGPALVAALLPTAVAVLAWTASRSRVATALAPCLVVLAQAPLFVFRDTMDITAGWLIPNRDYSDLFVVATLAVLIASSRALVPRWQAAAVLALLVLTAFTAAGSKGSALPALAGAVGLLALHSLLVRRGRVQHLAAAAAVGVGMLLAQYTVTKSLSYLRVDPLTFLGGQAPEGTDALMPLVVVVLLLSTLGHVLVTLVQAPHLVQPVLPLVGGGLGGLAALTLFGHPGLSQLYFLHAAWPLICTAVAIAAAVWVQALGPLSLAGPAAGAVAFSLVLAPPADGRVRTWALAAAVVLLLVLLVVVLPAVLQVDRRRPRLAHPRTALVAAVLSTGFLVQNWGWPVVALPASVPSAAADVSAVDGGQQQVFAALHQSSDASDLVMTNKHCLSGSVPAGTCDPRWFAVSAFAERRVLVEGWSYTRLSTGVWWEDTYWDPALLAANDAFIAAPEPAGCRRFVEEGVRWVYVDKREAWSPALDQVAEPVVDTASAALYRLTGDCTR